MMANISDERAEMILKVAKYEKYNLEKGEFYFPEGTPQEIIDLDKYLRETEPKVPECFK